MNRSDMKDLKRALSRARVEKICEVIPVKIQSSLHSWLKKRVGKGRVSGFVRQALIEKLERMVGDE